MDAGTPSVIQAMLEMTKEPEDIHRFFFIACETSLALVEMMDRAFGSVLNYSNQVPFATLWFCALL